MNNRVLESLEHQKLIEGYIDCYNRFDVDGMLAFLSDSIVFENESSGEINARANGKSAFKELAEQSAKMFSSRHQKITNIEANDELLVAYISYSGILAVDLPNGLTAGQSIELTGRSEFRFEGEIISHFKDIS